MADETDWDWFFEAFPEVRGEDLSSAELLRRSQIDDFGGEVDQYVTDLDRAMADLDSDFENLIKSR